MVVQRKAIEALIDRGKKWETRIIKDNGTKYLEHLHDNLRLIKHEIKKDRYGLRCVTCKKCKTRWLFTKNIDREVEL